MSETNEPALPELPQVDTFTFYDDTLIAVILDGSEVALPICKFESKLALIFERYLAPWAYSGRFCCYPYIICACGTLTRLRIFPEANWH
jgi:hypothetical protein